jgi:hypothetical protein
MVYLACFVDHSDKLSAGEVGFVLTIAPTQKQARLVHGYAQAFLESSPILRKQIIKVLADEIQLKGNIAIVTHPCSFRSVRGRTLQGVVFDESAEARGGPSHGDSPSKGGRRKFLSADLARPLNLALYAASARNLALLVRVAWAEKPRVKRPLRRAQRPCPFTNHPWQSDDCAARESDTW